jgi:hypothetical protein
MRRQPSDVDSVRAYLAFFVMTSTLPAAGKIDKGQLLIIVDRKEKFIRT